MTASSRAKSMRAGLASSKPVTRVTPKPAAPPKASRGTSSGPMTKPRGTGGNGPIGRNTGTPKRPRAKRY